MVKDTFHFIRTPNLVMVALAMWFFRKLLIGVFLTSQGFDFYVPAHAFTLLVADVIAVAIGGYWINDFFDRDIDRVNRPSRFLVKHNVPVRAFGLMYAVVLLAGAGLTCYIAIATGHEGWMWLYPLFAGGLYVYARWLKNRGWIGNLVVSAMIACLPWLLVIAEWPVMAQARMQDPDTFSSFIQNSLIYSALMFFSNMAREVCKDAEDIEGDRLHNRHTIPVTLGLFYSNGVIIGAIGITLLLEFMLLRAASSDEVPWAVGILIIAMGFALGVMTFRADSKPMYTRLSKWLKVFMLLGILQLIFVRL